jgi:2-phosphoglycerate kinase
MAESERRNLSDSTADDRRLWVDDAGRRRPFMRGIMIHSLMARGVGFDEATDTANSVRDRLRPREVVSKDEISFELRDILGDAPLPDDHALPVPPDISIVDKAGSQHFSKGVLSQSLLAAAIDPNDAFDVAREIERELLYKGIHEIERGDLRALTYGALCRTIGPQAGERYLIWRQYQEPDRPVILLLGGAAGVGKTSLALEVGHRLGIGRMLSTDSVRQIMRIMLSHELAPALQGVRASMDRAVAENASTVIDGVAIVPGMIELDAYRDLADVIFLVVATLDIDAYAGRFASRAKGQSHRAAHRYLENLDGIVRVQDYLLEAAERHAIPIVDNESFERAVVQIIRHVAETLRERRGLSIDEML